VYLISNYGNIKSTNFHGTGKTQLLKSRNVCGYSSVTLYIDKKRKYYLVHRLVAKAFLNNPLDLPCVNHKDENKSNNFVDNLEYCTHKYNCLYGTRISRISKALRKPIIGVNILSNETIIFDSAIQATKKGFNDTSIGRCCNGKQGQHLNYKWYFKKDYDKEVH